MQLAWYRKYRPQTFSEVVGQAHIKTTLLNQIKAGSFGHAYLFAGPKGTGKTSIARILARTVNCLDTNSPAGEGEACGKCAMCQAFDHGQMLDLIEIDAASNTGVDNIRDLIDKIALAPTMGRFKIYVIDEAHMLSKAAFNALLKTLEEPPAHAIFVLATTEPQKFPATIVSRCQRFDFHYLTVSEVADWLKTVAVKEQVKLADAAAELLAQEAGGSMRDAIALLEQAAAAGGEITKDQLTSWLGLVDWTTVYQLMQKVLAGETKAATAQLAQIYQDGYDLHRLAIAWIALVRQILTVKLGNASELGLSADRERQLGPLAEQLTLGEIAWLLEDLMQAATDIKTAAVVQLPLELVIVRAVHQLASAGHNNDNDQPPSSNMTQPPVSNKTGDPKDAVENWPRVVSAVRETHPTLAALLGQAHVDQQSNKLRATFGLPFHKEMVEQPANRQVVMGALQRLGWECTIECVVDAKPATPKGVAVEEVLQVFGQV
ncbi:MAG: polymerase III subunit gamma and tau, DNA polymerase III subunit gamma/tau protein [candidate division Kazan bacterium GW2011_GWA1_50_15]|uniref:DNA polymerase III subunit gamma/tau n=2 Tax=Bacteria division Kazan-3B-28 TaxID=1798534 RepID=A0A0G1X7A0_UNCK3|nr:MAG: polymerase III subunit gamma and tau, DNA polymerase III subunit gamma/tau protein [candidate division Kazan bacterium GW2011_GWA1_50_15]KKW25555.1 MAG: polymerase III subunit gamma and tau protein [candidate division Kazan bacterium GW2011_GWC1_52_13]KKW26861.1 MAG: polymerase III subunit gamma and tau protein [candidate division Kazan bacterium GW2011_GWB1_52_7]